MSIETPNHRATLVIATNNLGKLKEIRELLAGDPVQLLRPSDLLGHPVDVVEDGETFQANAELKARAVARATGAMTLADDSGLEVDALGGLPGVRSARFAGEGASDADNNAELLRRLSGCVDGPFAARFRCAIALFEPKIGRLSICCGACEGAITRDARGSAGFGYDPLFVVSGKDGRTMAELDPTEKNLVSHRGKALTEIRPLLLRAFASEGNY